MYPRLLVVLTTLCLSGCVRLGFDPGAHDAGPADTGDQTVVPADAAGDRFLPDTRQPEVSTGDGAVDSALPDAGDAGPFAATWVAGSKTGGTVPVFGTLGVPAAANTPGGRYGARIAVDSKGALWLFGGNTSPSSAAEIRNDLWRYENKTWTWISGSKSTLVGGVYGTKGVAAASNTPGARQCPCLWFDASDTLWLFGGWGRDSLGTSTRWLNDLWRFDGQTWTWVGGSNLADQPAVYGTQGVAAPGNTPGGRDAFGYRDGKGRFWMFGGKGYTTSSSWGHLNELWRFDGQWAWIAGSQQINPLPVYGTQGVAAASNQPGGRTWSAVWHDGSALWVFGGQGIDADSKLRMLADLWRYAGGQWTWLGGSKLGNTAGTHGTKSVASPTSWPGARARPVCWRDGGGRMVMLAGYGFAGSSTVYGYLNDLWRFDGTQWTWVAGSDTVDAAGTFGTQGVSSASNIPSARWSAGWVRGQGGGWLFGGLGVNVQGTVDVVLDDLWHIKP